MHRTTLAATFFIIFLVALLVAWFGARLIMAWFSKRCRRRWTCYALPPLVRRNPDPCIYSQSFIQKFFPETPVTWDNPDIWIEDDLGNAVSAHALAPDTRYNIRARISNAAFAPAIGTKITCRVRDFGFGGEWITVADANGNNQVVNLDISGWNSRVASFHWRTPQISGHFCLMIAIEHLDDSNTWNNEGQTNTDVIGIKPGETAVVSASLPPGSDPLEYKSYVYAIPATPIDLLLGQAKPRHEGVVRGGSRSQPWLSFQRTAPGEQQETAINNLRYYGRDQVLQAQQQALLPLPSGWSVVVTEGQIAAAAQVNVAVPADARLGVRMPITITATDPLGTIVGGITLIVEVT